MQPEDQSTNPTSSNQGAQSEPYQLTPLELDQLADKLIELMLREIRLDHEREGKAR